MKIKTSDLTGAALDWAVCMALGMKPEDILIYLPGPKASLYKRLRDEDGQLNHTYMTGPDLLFSRRWEAGGPIIERERLWVCSSHQSKGWFSESPRGDVERFLGPTPLVAAMRCFAASKLGCEVEIPMELAS